MRKNHVHSPHCEEEVKVYENDSAHFSKEEAEKSITGFKGAKHAS